MAQAAKAVIVDPDWDRASELQRILQEVGVETAGHANFGVEAVTLASEVQPQFVFVRFDEPHERAAQTISSLLRRVPEAQPIAYTGRGTTQIARQAMLAGARDFLAEPLTPEMLEQSMTQLLSRFDENAERRSESASDQPVALGTVITVFGAKGGIGKTTLASNLAVALATEARQSVALVDMDTRFGDVAVMMNIEPRTSIADLTRDLDTLTLEGLDDYLVHHESGVDILPAPGSPTEWRNISPDNIHDVIDVLAQTHDFVVLDTPGAINEVVTAAIEAGTMLLLLTTLDMASVKDTVLVLEMLEERFPGGGDRIRVVLNRAGQNIGVTEKDVQRTLDRDLWARVPEDSEIGRSSQVGVPIVLSHPNNRAAREIRAIAAAIAGVRTPSGSKDRDRGASGFSLGRAIRGVFGGSSNQTQGHGAEAASG